VIITSIEALIIRIPADRGGAGRLAARSAPDAFSAAPGDALETVLARVTRDDGLTGWGESQAVSAPEVAGTIIHSILKPALEGKPFGGTALEIEALWNAMYNRMRTCGQTGGFMLDAMAAVDIALWDLAGKIHKAPISALIAGKQARTEVAGYVDTIAGDSRAERTERARAYHEAGCSRFKIYYEGSSRELLDDYDALAEVCGPANIAVDASWRLDPAKAAAFGAELDRRGAMWLECPFPPEDAAPHAALAQRMRTPIAIGEAYRTRFELAPFVRAHAMGIVQPDLGRCGLTESLRIANAADRAGMEVVPHLAPALGPLLFATLQFAAATPNCRFVPYSSELVETVNGFAAAPLAFRKGRYRLSGDPGLGIDLMEPEVRLVAVA
jgi:D-galactarolactone cycloisomerase